MDMDVDTFFQILNDVILLIAMMEEDVRGGLEEMKGLMGRGSWGSSLAWVGGQQQPDKIVRTQWVVGDGGRRGSGRTERRMSKLRLNHRWPTLRAWAFNRSLEDAGWRWSCGELLRALEAVPALGGA